MTEPEDTSSENRRERKAPALPELPPGFEGCELLGEGAHGTVIKSTNTLLSRTVAIKFIRNDGSQDMQRQTERIQKEARLLAKLKHENIVQVFQVGITQDSRPYLVCEYLDGITLDKILVEKGKLSRQEIRIVFAQVLDALQFAHENGLVHRDVKPANIMLLKESVSSPYKVKLLDFGIARDMELATASGTLTNTSLLSGTPAYMSPEQCQAKALDSRSDLYSLACVLHECLFGSPPFVDESTLAVQYSHIHEPAASLATLKDKSNGESLNQLLLAALDKNPSLRPSTALDFKRTLLRVIKDDGNDESANDLFAGRRKLIIPGVLVIVIFMVITGFSWHQMQQVSSEKKNDTAHSSEALKRSSISPRKLTNMHSGLDILKVLAGRYSKQSSTEDCQKIYDELIANEKLCTGKKELVLIYNHFKATLLAQLHRPLAEIKEAENKAIAACSLPDNKVAVQASHIYYFLATYEEQPKEKERLLRKALEIYEQMDEPTLVIPDEFFAIFPTELEIKIHGESATLAEQIADYPRALEEYKIAAQKLGYEAGGIACQKIAIANVLLKMQKKDEAIEFLNNYERALRSEVTTSAGGDFRRLFAVFLLGRWCYEQQEIDRSKTLFLYGLKLYRKNKFLIKEFAEPGFKYSQEASEAIKKIDAGIPIISWKYIPTVEMGRIKSN